MKLVGGPDAATKEVIDSLKCGAAAMSHGVACHVSRGRVVVYAVEAKREYARRLYAFARSERVLGSRGESAGGGMRPGVWSSRRYGESLCFSLPSQVWCLKPGRMRRIDIVVAVPTQLTASAPAVLRHRSMSCGTASVTSHRRWAGEQAEKNAAVAW